MVRKHHRLRSFALLGLLCLFFNSYAEEKHQWNLKDVNIQDVMMEVSKQTGKTFIIDPDVSGNITLVSQTPLNSEEAYQLFLSVLGGMGFTAIPSGNTIHIVLDKEGKYHSPFVSQENMVQNPAVMVTSVLSLSNTSATKLIPSLKTLVSPDGILAAYDPANSLIVVDHAENIVRIDQIISQLDVASSDTIELIKLKHASAIEVANTLNQLVTTGRRSEQIFSNIVIAVDERSNSLLLGGDKNTRLQLHTMIRKLDVETSSEGNTEVIYLKFQKAEDLIPTLSTVMSSFAANVSGKGDNKSALPDPTMLATRTPAEHNNPDDKDDSSHLSASARKSTGFVISNYGIHAEPNMNALVITAPTELMHTLKQVIAKLDIRRAQMLVEAIIVEISGNLSDELGIEWQVGGDFVGGVKLPGGERNTFSDDSKNPFSFLFSGLNVGFIHNKDIRVILHALQSNSNTNILSTPSLVAMDNAEAEIKVADTIPFPIGEYATTGGVNTVTPFITKEYRDVGLRLTILPQITQDKAIQLDIEQIVDSLGIPMKEGPTTRTREMRTRVLVDDADILVLGGLIRTENKETYEKVPLLGDIPLLKYLFRSKLNRIEKTNLMIFLRPTILRDSKQSSYASQQKYNWLKKEQLIHNARDPYHMEFPRNAAELSSLPLNNIELPPPFAEEE